MKDYSAETGAALADEDQTIKAFAHAVVTPATRTPSPGTFATIALDRITPSLTNPRKTFDPAKLQDLAESIRSSGVHQPVVVRSLPGSRLADTDRTVQYELAPCELAGEVNAGDYSNAKYHPGDRLWVRETWYCDDYRVQQGPYLLPDGESADDMRDVGNLVYRADDECPYEQEQPVWRPSIHMPRWASRMMWW